MFIIVRRFSGRYMQGSRGRGAGKIDLLEIDLAIGPFLVIVETASYFIRALSLGIRLAANISAGHLLFAILASFAKDHYKGIRRHEYIIKLHGHPRALTPDQTILDELIY